jgi:Flp pilus assembly protein protease CpaA
MGDLKLTAALGAILGPVTATTVVLVSAVVGGLLAAWWMVKPWVAYGIQTAIGRGGFKATSTTVAEETPERILPAGKIPYGVALSAGTLLTLAASWFTGEQRWPF